MTRKRRKLCGKSTIKRDEIGKITGFVINGKYRCFEAVKMKVILSEKMVKKGVTDFWPILN